MCNGIFHKLSIMQTTDYHRVARAIEYLEANHARQPALADVARGAGLSESHFHRLFTRWAGITPKRFLQVLTLERAKHSLSASASVLGAAYATGLSGPGRLHDLFVTLEAMTPGEFKSGGRGITIHWGVHPTPFGDALLGVTPRGICHLTFTAGDSPDAEGALRERWPRAVLRHQPESTGAVARSIFLSPDEDHSARVSEDEDRGSGRAGTRREIRLLAGGTNFQVRVWDALLRIPPGEVTTYGEIARLIGQPSAARAAGSAIGSNSIAYLIPCHRVIRKTGGLGGYRWGSDRKRALLAWEAAHTSEAE